MERLDMKYVADFMYDNRIRSSSYQTKRDEYLKKTIE